MLNLTEEERQQIKVDLSKMIDMVSTLSKIDTENVTPLKHVNNHEQVLREDIVDNMLPNEKVFLNSADNINRYFTVPKVIKQ
ncbi:MAG: Asp-tRNA(Asn)/Glu-tRNA(Gln) amidotransferase subunit GatC [Saprospiraceae bacterium]|nr:Asp-tRNA(Asn)/Glu-tRNA(Gln) amidotransferase subunit GatC [Bacteroidia bacterium]NNE15506.1 Asp-tRNA(Asn)/Glu-tRNA(Gln) amidotransferase subunit GatC [Saprospiraceae bacterium]NNL91597.1 Asp-tRNA(Asn)/Glu-tRNA(Gln) amidotransferase subunit GatC [Saprospiraceae bacterium]